MLESLTNEASLELVYVVSTLHTHTHTEGDTGHSNTTTVSLWYIHVIMLFANKEGSLSARTLF